MISFIRAAVGYLSSGLLYFIGTLSIFCQYAHAAPAACSRPVSYRIGEIDPEFGLSRTTVRSIAAAAARIWEQGTGGKRFVETKDGHIEIRLKYSKRQDLVEARKLLEEQGQLVTQSVEKFNDIQSRLNGRIESFNAETKEYTREMRAHTVAAEQYRRAGAYRPEYAKHLTRQRSFLRDWYGRLQKQKQALDAALARTDADRRVVSRQVDGYNKDTGSINEILARMPDYEKLGEYRAEDGTHSITLYVYRDMDQLRILLAHELGHALGIEHVAVPAALMYPRETEDNTELRTLHADDLRAYRRVCGGSGPQPGGNYF